MKTLLIITVGLENSRDGRAKRFESNSERNLLRIISSSGKFIRLLRYFTEGTAMKTQSIITMRFENSWNSGQIKLVGNNTFS